jgi:hypothetical protein
MVSQASGSRKMVVAIAFPGAAGLPPSTLAVNKDSFVNVILEGINTTYNHDQSQRATKHMSIQIDDCKAYNEE